MSPKVLCAGAALAAALTFTAACGGSAGSAPEPAKPPAPSQGAPVPGGGLTIQEAIDSTLAGPLAVKGFVVAADGEPVRLCSALAESYPPQCGGPSLVVEGLDVETLEGLVRPDEPEYAHTAWTETEVSLLGEVEDGVITVSKTSI